jgi:fatty-acid peroxygenase
MRGSLAALGDDSIGLLIRGYDVGTRIWPRAHWGSRSAPMTLLGRDALLVRGGAGVSLFYDETKIRRHGAMPAFVQEILFGHGSVHSLDGPAHRHRKATFVDVAYDDAEVDRLLPLLDEEWRRERDVWIGGGARTAYEAAVGALGRAVMRWAGLPGTADAQTRWAGRLAQIVDGFGSPYSFRFLLAVLNRWWSDRHAQKLIEAVRSGELTPPSDSAASRWAWHRDDRARLLPARLAGVELQNSIRPMIAVARFVAFAAKELHDRPSWRARIAAETAERGTLVGGPLATAFAHEIRRTAPFVPMLPGWAREDVELDGRRLKAGGRVVLDLQATNRDERSWHRPELFEPERFDGVADYEALTTFIPQGGGDVASGHRCPGEKLTIAGLATAIAALSDPRLVISGRGLRVDRRRLPTMPASGAQVSAEPSPSRCPFH